MSSSKPVLVNLGCGTRYHRDWLNFDLARIAPEVRRADFVRGVPVAEGSADAIYHSHVLEHLPLPVARTFLGQCLKALKPGGLVRIVVPDLEQSVRDYLAALDARRGGADRRADHRWLLIEIFDQMVRTRPGGDFAGFLAEKAGNDDFVLPRIGAFGARLAKEVRATGVGNSRLERWQARLQRWLPGNWGRLLGEARFRQSGDVHQWMYDELFLGDLLREIGFAQVKRHTHLTSGIAEFASYGLDAEPDGTPWKGVSLYVEAQRP